MNKKDYTIGSFAKLTSTTEGTLRFYESKGLLKPSSCNERGHRTYSDEDLFRLHQILTLKYLDYSLDEIGKYLEQSGKDFHSSLEMQYELLLQKQQHIQNVVNTVERTRSLVKENDTLDPRLTLQMIRSIQHEEEQKQWLSEHLPDEHAQSILRIGASLESELMNVFNDLLVMFRQGLPPDDPHVQERALALKQFFEQMLGQPLQELETSETGKVLKQLDPQLFPTFEPEFMNYWTEALGHLFRRIWEAKMNVQE